MMKKSLFFIFLLSASANAQVGSIFGVGPRSQALGGTSLFQGSQNSYQVYSAPAALGFMREVEVSIAAQYMDPQLKPFGTLVLNSNGTLGEFKTAGVLPGGGQVFSVAFPIGKERPLTLAANFYLPFSTLVRVSGSPVDYPFYPLYNDISRNFFFVIGAGYELMDGLAIGLNMRSTTKSTAVYALRADNSINYSASAVEAKSESRVSVSAVYDFAKKNPTKPYSIGFMYRAKAGLETKLVADITAFVPVQGELTSSPYYSPAEWVFMSSGRFAEKWTVSLDASWVKWSKYSSPYGSGNINSYVIGANKKSAMFRDIFVPKLGIDYKESFSGKALKEFSVRFGYMFYKSPVPDQTEDSNFVDSDRHGITMGFGFGFKNPWKEQDLLQIDLFGQYNLLRDRLVRKSSSTKIGAPGYTAGGKILIYGLGGTIHF